MSRWCARWQMSSWRRLTFGKRAALRTGRRWLSPSCTPGWGTSRCGVWRPCWACSASTSDAPVWPEAFAQDEDEDEQDDDDDWDDDGEDGSRGQRSRTKTPKTKTTNGMAGSCGRLLRRTSSPASSRQWRLSGRFHTRGVTPTLTYCWRACRVRAPGRFAVPRCWLRPGDSTRRRSPWRRYPLPRPGLSGCAMSGAPRVSSSGGSRAAATRR